MSISVAINELEAAMAKYRFAYFLTVTEDGRPHAVAVTPTLSDGELHVEGLGRHTVDNATARSSVSLVWPPALPDDYTLIVDGEAHGSEGSVTLRPTRAVLHRPRRRPGVTPQTSCDSDCVPIATDS